MALVVLLLLRWLLEVAFFSDAIILFAVPSFSSVARIFLA